jgi:hypothetical protein
MECGFEASATFPKTKFEETLLRLFFLSFPRLGKSKPFSYTVMSEPIIIMTEYMSRIMMIYNMEQISFRSNN